MKLEFTDLVVYGTMIILLAGMPLLLQYGFGLPIEKAYLFGLPLGFGIFLGIIVLISTIAGIWSDKTHDDRGSAKDDSDGAGEAPPPTN